MLFGAAHWQKNTVIFIQVICDLLPGLVLETKRGHKKSYCVVISCGRKRAIWGKRVIIAVVSSMRKKKGRA
jgi:hypothetical protein